MSKTIENKKINQRRCKQLEPGPGSDPRVITRYPGPKPGIFSVQPGKRVRVITRLPDSRPDPVFSITRTRYPYPEFWNGRVFFQFFIIFLLEMDIFFKNFSLAGLFLIKISKNIFKTRKNLEILKEQYKSTKSTYIITFFVDYLFQKTRYSFFTYFSFFPKITRYPDGYPVFSTRVIPERVITRLPDPLPDPVLFHYPYPLPETDFAENPGSTH